MNGIGQSADLRETRRLHSRFAHPLRAALQLASPLCDDQVSNSLSILKARKRLWRMFTKGR